MFTLETRIHRPDSIELAGAAGREVVLTFVLVRAVEGPSGEVHVGSGPPLSEAELSLIEERARALIKQHWTPAGAGPACLTVRELEVLKLIAAGRRNHQIAEDLVISLHTVARHVSNIFCKTGVANRAEAATFAARYGLT